MSSDDVRDSWEDEVAEKVEKVTLSTPSKGLNLDAPSFVPNLNAAEFVPSWLNPPAPASNPAPTSSSQASESAKTSPSKSQTKSASESPSKPASGSPSKTDSAAKQAKAGPKPSPKKEPAQAKPTPPAEPAELSKEEEEIAAEFFASKEHLNLVFIGHVDAGKSTMGGHILYVTGMVDKRTLEKFEREAKEANRESWYLSWALDTNKEERAKGKTVEVGKAHFETDKRKYTILDAPGHKNYVPNMIGGAAQADIAVLVISARKGEFETGFEKGGQTREHAMLVKTAGIRKLVVVINKMDDPTVGWSAERYNECVSKLTPFLKQVGYNPKTDLYFMPVSGFTGANLKDRVEPKVCPFYSGPSLLEYLDNVSLDNRLISGPLIMPVTDKFKEMGTMVSGKIESGRVKKGDSVMVMPIKRVCEVLGIYEEEDEVNTAKCGDNARLRLKGVEEEEIHIGFVVCDTVKPVAAVTSFEAQLVILETKSIICAGYSAVMHIHTAIEEVTLSALLHTVDKKTGRKTKKPPMFVKKGQMVIARLETTHPICIDTFKVLPQLGRFTLRNENTTVAMGKVTKLCE
ncbi:P-loop containing nucleoside triphosphate hydrolase protein [Paraphysoderma sedebokerense]|nr:P-loop containing nucleoside triphosphate hydrolase protein [Paraphysoderma sedebokerense]